MKRKLIIALAAAMAITIGCVGIVSADDTNFAPFIPVNYLCGCHRTFPRQIGRREGSGRKT